MLFSVINNYCMHMVFYNIFYDCLSWDKVNVLNLWPGGKECAFYNKSYFEIQLKVLPN